MKVEKKTLCLPKVSGNMGKIFSRCLKFLGRLENIYILVAQKNPQCLHPFQVLSQVKRVQCNIRSSWEEHKGDNFNLLKSFQGVKLTSLFHADLIPNLGKLKIFSPRVEISQHIYRSLNQNPMSFAKSIF